MNTIKSKIINSKIKINKMFDENDNIRGVKTLYGLTKLTSEMLIEEFSYAFGIKYIINRCGVISGPLIWKTRSRIYKPLDLETFKPKEIKLHWLWWLWASGKRCASYK